MIAWFLMKSDNKNEDLIGVDIFESKQTHLAKANSLEQNESFTKIMKHLESEPKWTDVECIIGTVA
ncbi:MAG: hypothetical protein DK302_001290 [Chloroflexi bacterium]|jgi:hypothetical protein|nr:MAG: hypothetical protein DK302_001290 [Chloroflexota bacterium]